MVNEVVTCTHLCSSLYFNVLGRLLKCFKWCLSLGWYDVALWCHGTVVEQASKLLEGYVVGLSKHSKMFFLALTHFGKMLWGECRCILECIIDLVVIHYSLLVYMLLLQSRIATEAVMIKTVLN
jgi:hypothetical protein